MIDFPFGDEAVAMRVKSVATKAEQPCVEVSDENFRALFCWYKSEASLAEGAPLAPKPAALHGPRLVDEGREYYRKDRSAYYLLRSEEALKAASSDGSSPVARTEVCGRRALGRPRKQARVAGESDSLSTRGASNSDMDASAGSESHECPGTEF